MGSERHGQRIDRRCILAQRAMRHIHTDPCPDIATVFLVPPRAIAEVSSSMVKGLVGPAGWEELVAQYVPAPVLERQKGLRRASV
jgi:pantetheine-phosphate adenylyltransferase